MGKLKHDYDSDEFYEEILSLALQGFNDAEIADSLDLTPDTFGSMKNGNYNKWSAEENKRRGERIERVLTRGRRKIVSILRGRYIKAALGGIKTKNTSRSVKRVLVNGEPTGEEVEQVTTGEVELPPNMQAIATLLYHYDKDWRKVQRNQDEDASDIPTDIEHGISVDDWIRKEVESSRDLESSES